MTDSLISASEVMARTGWRRPTLRRRIEAGVFPGPSPLDPNKWSKRAVDEALGAAPKESDAPKEWTVDPKAIEMAVARYIRRAKKSAAGRSGRRNVAHPIRGSAAPSPLRVVADNQPPGQTPVLHRTR